MTPVNGHEPEEHGSQYPRSKDQRQKVVVVGLGMVGIAFMFVVPLLDISKAEADKGAARSFSRWTQRGGNMMWLSLEKNPT